MADVTRARPTASASPTDAARDGHDAAPMSATATGRRPMGRGEVRARLAVEGPGDPAAIRVAPASDDMGEGVLAQRHPLVDGEPAEVELRPADGGRLALVEAGDVTRAVVGRAGHPRRGVTRLEVLVDGFRFEVDVEPERLAALRERAARGRSSAGSRGPLDVRAIIPGKVVAVSVVPGDAVTAGQQLLVVEAMKMQNELRAPRAGTVQRVEVGTGANIEVGSLLLVLGEEAPA